MPVARSMLEHVAGFARALYDADMPVSPGHVIDLCQCFRHIEVTRRDDFYAAARATLISRREDIERFDAVFDRYWNASKTLPVTPPEKPDGGGPGEAKPGLDRSSSTESGEDGQDRERALAYSAEERLAESDLGTLADGDIERARHLLREMLAALANRRGRLMEKRHRGQPDLRRLLRTRDFHTAEGICPLPWKARRIARTRLVVLCDVSGSMQRYSRFLLEFMFALRRELFDLQVAVFSTRLTLITELLRARGVADSLREVSRQVPDWAGGTDIGASLHDFNERLAPRVMNGRTAVIFLSDGWDRGDPALMREQMALLRRRASKLVWLNPLLGIEGYQPLTRGMQSALPYLDHFLPAHNLASLVRMAHLLRQIGAC